MNQTEWMTRPIRLSAGWYQSYCGDIAAKRTDGTEVRLIAGRTSGYRYRDEDGTYRKVTKRNEGQFLRDAVLYYRPLGENVGFRGLVKYLLRQLSLSDVLLILLCTVMITLAGLLYPMASNLLYNKLIAAHMSKLLGVVLGIFLGIAVTGALFQVIKNYILAGIRVKLATLSSAALFGRCLALPASFYKENPAGQVSEWLQSIPTLCKDLTDLVFGTWISSLLSLLYLVQIYLYAPKMLGISVLLVAAFFVICFISALLESRWLQKQLESQAKLMDVTYDLLSGVEKIKLGNARDKALTLWLSQYEKLSQCTYAPPVWVRLSAVLPVLLSSFAGIAVLLAAKSAGLDTGEYMTFYAAFGMVLGSAMAAGKTANKLASVKPRYEQISPILSAKTELYGREQAMPVKKFDIALKNVSFGYTEDRPILNDLSVEIPYGDYVALVGSTGSGKSTLLRLLLGFEMPSEGTVCYGGTDLKLLNVTDVRSHLGVVLQSDKLFMGSILENMTMVHPDATEQQIWDALKIAGIDEDVREMPMQLHTLVGERSAFSGGQMQRLHIARAIIGNPNVLILDEATSALDNETQAKIAMALDGMACTRIVVAHRLSTIKNARRILVLEGGKLVEDGNYAELLQKRGKFFDLVQGQV